VQNDRAKDVNRLTAKTDRLWTEIREYNEDIVGYLSDGTYTDNINKAFNISIKLIIAELLVNREKYDKYPIKKLTTDDFIKMAIVDPTKKKIDLDIQEECEPFMEEVRSIIWGYIRQHYNDLKDLFLSINSDNRDDITEEEMDRLIECLCVTYIETNFRRRELYFLERDFE
jgi:hypothetical protein